MLSDINLDDGTANGFGRLDPRSVGDLPGDRRPPRRAASLRQ
jgi:hypothetical protein